MEQYKRPYLLLFRAVTEALEQMQQQNFGRAKELLICAQQQAEEVFVDFDGEEGELQ